MLSTAIVLMQIDRLCSDAVHCYCLNADRPSGLLLSTAIVLMQIDILCSDDVK